MLNIVVFSGGTGSISLQNGLKSVLGTDRVNLDIVINAFDNGKSTGICRQIANNKILGPSDLRKNQLTSFRNKYLQKENSIRQKQYDLFNKRISASNSNEYRMKALKELEKCSCFPEKVLNKLSLYVMKFLKERYEFPFTNFSLSNIFYAQSALEHNNSLSEAGKEMASILEIEDNIHLISDKSLFLKAKTESGHIIEDEGEIVSWNNEDRIESIFFINPLTNKRYVPKVDEGNNENRVMNVISKADIIIFSAGTQWSSLIPTYVHSNFRKILEKSKAKKYLVMNNTQDKDMKGVGPKEILDIISKYINLKNVTVVYNNNANENMKLVVENNPYEKYIVGDLSDKDSRTHDPIKLVTCILSDYFGIKKTSILVSDLDGTLIDSLGNSEIQRISKENLKKFSGIILTGNTEEYVKSIIPDYESMDIYCNYGNIHLKNGKKEVLVTEDIFLDHNIIDNLKKMDEYKDKIINRSNVILTIKPLFQRETHLKRLEKFLSEHNLEAYIAGRTSIDIHRKLYSKKYILERILKKEMVYIGNELNDLHGNDKTIKELDIHTINVKSPIEMNNILNIYQNMFF